MRANGDVMAAAKGVTVEFYGIPRQRAGTASVDLPPARLGEVLAELSQRFPRLAEECLDGPRLRPGFIANLNGERFVSDPQTPLSPGDALLVLSTDAGG